MLPVVVGLGILVQRAVYQVRCTSLGIKVAHSLITRSAHSTRETKIEGLPNFAP
jgi:hypothetical protein